MDRRDFLKRSSFASGALMVPGFLQKLSFLSEEQLSGYKNVVIIQFSGGNDGLNSVVPFTNDLYHNLRPDIALNAKDLLKLTDDLALNGSMKALKELYDNGELCIINNVGYPNPNRSHFRSMDIWHSASDSNQYLTTGWLGRYMDANCQNPYEVLEADSSMSLALKGHNLSGMAVKDAKLLYNSTREPYFKELVKHTDDTMLSEDNMGYLYKTMVDTYNSADYIFETSKIYKSNLDYSGNGFAKQIKNITELIISGLKTRVYYVSLGGFDTHVNQVGQHNKLLKTYADAVGTMVKDLKQNNRFKDTLIMTFSEFGRRAKQNASRGTDHGAASNVYLIGGALKKAGVYNEIPDLKNLDDNGDIQYSVDFRQIYATILDNWLEVKDDNILLQSFNKMTFV